MMWYYNHIWSIILLHTWGKLEAASSLEWGKQFTNLNGKKVSESAGKPERFIQTTLRRSLNGVTKEAKGSLS